MSVLRISVLGSGAWGTALASHMALQHKVLLWGRNPTDIQALQQSHQSRYLPGVKLCPALQYTHRLEEALQHGLHECSLWVLAVPTQAMRTVLLQMLQTVDVSLWPPMVWLCKGLEQNTHLLPHQVVAQVLKQVPKQISNQHSSPPAHHKAPHADGFSSSANGVLTGPSFAEELAKGLPCALTMASTCVNTQTRVMHAVHHGVVRVYPIDDVMGAELGGALKNIMAIATGVCDGLALGANARAALITRGMVEMRRLAVVLGAQPDTLYGLSGLGDLILTCTGALSRNRRVGMALAGGAALPAILQELGQVAEGVHTAPVVAVLAAKHEVDMPIVSAVCALLEGRLTAQQAVDALMGREIRRGL